MDTILFIFCIIFFFIFSTIFIKKYNNSVKKKNINAACHDIMNKKLFSLYGINACIWNLSHVLIYCFICAIYMILNSVLFKSFDSLMLVEKKKKKKKKKAPN